MRMVIKCDSDCSFSHRCSWILSQVTDLHRQGGAPQRCSAINHHHFAIFALKQNNKKKRMINTFSAC